MPIPNPFPNIKDYDLSDNKTLSSAKISAGLNVLKSEIEDIKDTEVEQLASGAVVTFKTSVENAIISAEFDIIYQQESGTPSPDTPLPITGFTCLTITNTGSDDSETILVDWTDDAGTVYVGKLDLLTGILTVTYIMLDLGEQTYYKVNDNGRYYFRSTLVKPATSSAHKANGACEQYRMVAQNNLANNCISIDGFVGNPFINIIDERYAGYTPENFAQALNGIKFVTELATPVEYQLIAQQLINFIGENTISCNTGDTNITYKLKIKDLLN